MSSPIKATAGMTTPIKTTPEKRYPVYVSPESERLRVAFSPNGRKIVQSGPGTYSWMGPDGRYIGCTTRKLFVRINEELSLGYCGERTKLGRAMHAQPTAFSVGVICQTDDLKKVAALEKRAIIEKDAIRKGYNERNGGGGGVAQSSAGVDSIPFEKALKIFKKTFVEPKWRPVLVENKRIKNPLTCSENKLRGKVYDIVKTDPDGTRTHYVGYTSRKVGDRISEHFSNANNPGSNESNDVYRDLHDNPERFSVGIVPISKELIGKVSLSTLEKVTAAYLKSVGEKLYNKNRGGGGGFARP